MGGVSAVTLDMIGWKEQKSGRWLAGNSMRINQSALLEWFCFLTIPVVFSNTLSLRLRGWCRGHAGCYRSYSMQKNSSLYDQLNMCHGLVFLNLVSPRRPFTLLYGQHMCFYFTNHEMSWFCGDCDGLPRTNPTAKRLESAKHCQASAVQWNRALLLCFTT